MAITWPAESRGNELALGLGDQWGQGKEAQMSPRGWVGEGPRLPASQGLQLLN